MQNTKTTPDNTLTPILVTVPFYIAMLAGGFSGTAKAVFALSALYALFYCIKTPHFVRTLLQPAHLTGSALILFVASSGLWGEGERADRYLRYGAFLYLFWIMISIAAQASTQRLTQVAKLLLTITSLVALYGVTTYFLDDNAPRRNQGPGMLRHPILGPSVLIATGATGIMLLQSLQRAHILWPSLTFLTVLAYTLTTQSRGPLLAVSAWGLMLIFTCGMGKKIKATILALTLIAAAIAVYSGSNYIEGLLKRGSSHRLTIWQHTLPQIQKHPVIGHGITLDFTQTSASKAMKSTIGTAIEHPHNLMLATLVYSGGAGLILMVATMLTGPLTLLRRNKKAAAFLLPPVTAVIFLSLTDLSKLVTEPSPIWFAFWLPIAFIAGLSSRTMTKNQDRAMYRP